MRAGVVRASSAGRSSNEAFYVTGVFQLAIMQRLLGDQEMLRVTDAITRSTQPSGPNGAVFGRFAALVARDRAGGAGPAGPTPGPTMAGSP